MLVRNCLWLLIFLLSCSQAAAADKNTWQPVPGDAIALAGSARTVYAVGRDYSIWQWQREVGYWGRFPGKSRQVIVAPSGQLWGIATDGTVQRHNGMSWESIGIKAMDIAITQQDDLILVLENGDIRKRSQGSVEPAPLPGSAKRIVVSRNGELWKLNVDGEIAHWVGTDWQRLPGRARDIAASPDGTIYIVSPQGELMQWDPSAENWRILPSPPGTAKVAAGFANTLWVALDNGAVQAKGEISAPQKTTESVTTVSNGITLHRGRGGRGVRMNDRVGRAAARAGAIVATKPAAATTDTSPFTFTDTQADGKVLAIGADGSIFAIGRDDSFYQWRNAEQRFKAFPGNLVKIAVDPHGSPWGINMYGRIFRHNGSDWVQVRGTASDIAIGANGRVIVTDAAGRLSEYDSAILGFKLMPGMTAYFPAIAPDGVPWGLLQDGTVVRCAQTPCERLPKQAGSIAIGPDGSVFVVTTAGRLERYRAANSDWEIIPVNGLKVAKVAVGPKGRPWVVTEDGSVLYSTLFPRDESTDNQTAAITQSSTTGSGDVATVVESGGFIVTKNMQFGSIASSLAYLESVTVGPDGTVLALGYADDAMTIPAYEQYDEKTKKLVPKSVALPGGDRFFTAKTAADGSLWLLSATTDGRVYHQKGNGFETFDILNAAPCTEESCSIWGIDMDIAPDGTVYVITSSGTLYWKSTQAKKFSKLISGAFRRVAASRSGDVWAITGDEDQLVKQIVSGRAMTRALKPQEFPVDIAGGSDGSVYITYAGTTGYMLARWNATSQSFDKVSQQATQVAVSPEGRPWVVDDILHRGLLFYAKH